MSILLVEWIDAADVTDTWTHVDDLDLEVRTTVTVGHELENALPGHVVLVQSMAGDMVDNVMQIPVGMVRYSRILFDDQGAEPIVPTDASVARLYGGDRSGRGTQR